LRPASIVPGRALAGQLLEHAGERDAGPPGEVVAEPPVVRRLDPQIGLIVDRVDEVPGVADRIVGAPHRPQRDQPRASEQDRLVALDLAPHAGPEHLDRDLAPVEQVGAMDLRDAGRGDRPGLEVAEHLAQGPAQLGLDRRLDPAKRERRQPILQPAQLVDDLRLEQIRTRAHHLTELDEGRAECGHRAREQDEHQPHDMQEISRPPQHSRAMVTHPPSPLGMCGDNAHNSYQVSRTYDGPGLARSAGHEHLQGRYRRDPSPRAREDGPGRRHRVLQGRS
jgi:hypothetical protein